MSETWRRPIVATAEEAVGHYAGEPKRAIMWWVEGPNQEEDIERLRTGLACAECLSTFPVAPDMKNITVWRKYAHEWNHIRPEPDTMELVAKGMCPTCASEVSNEMFSLGFREKDPFAPQALEDIVG